MIKLLGKLVKLVVFIAILVFGYLGASYGVSELIKSRIGQDWLFYQENHLAFLFYTIALVLLLLRIYTVLTKERRMFRGIFTRSLVFAIAVYIFINTITVVYPDRINVKSPLNPNGVNYQYTNVDKVEAYFHPNAVNFFSDRSKGDFIYTIHIGNKSQDFIQPTPNPETQDYDMAPYINLRDFDKALMEAGAVKESSPEFADRNSLERKYVEIFMEIINNR